MLITLAIGGIYLYSVWKHRQDPGVGVQKDTAQQVNKDDLAVVRAFFPQHFEDTLRLEGTTVWMKDGYAIPYFALSGGKVDFARRMGTLAPLERLEVKKIIKAAVPDRVDDGIEHGSRQAMAVFVLPDSTSQYAAPIGYMSGSDEAYYADLLFFYDDPHTIYSDWPKNVWAAIDAHRVEPGMSELETRLSLGQKMHPDGQIAGDRTVTYDANGKQWRVTFVKDRATEVKAG